MYTYSWFTLLYGRNQHNLVKQLYSNENQLKIKQPLLKAYIISENSRTLGAINLFKDNIKDEVNIKEVVVSNSVEMFNTYYLTVNFKTAGAVLKGEVQKLKKFLEDADSKAMQEMVVGFNCGKVVAGEFGELDASLFVKNSKPKEEFVLANENELTVVIDTTLTQELIDEGVLREIIRNAQILRKEADFNIESRILINITSKDSKITQLISNNADKIKQEVLAQKLNEGKFECDIERSVELGGSYVNFELKAIK